MSKVKFKFDENAIKNKIMEAARQKVAELNYDVECPHCHAKINVPAGISNCPACGEQINLQLNINF